MASTTVTSDSGVRRRRKDRVSLSWVIWMEVKVSMEFDRGAGTYYEGAALNDRGADIEIIDYNGGFEKMNINGIGTTGYPAWQGARRTQQNAAGKSFAAQMNNVAGAKPHTSIVYMKTDDMLYSGGNGTGLSFYIKYAEGSTEDDPTVIAKGVDENGNEFEQTIHINKINPKCATVVEMRALEAHLGVDKNGGISSLPPETGEMGLHDRADFMDMFQKQISDMRLLGQQKLVAYYQYSMQAYWDFMNRK